MANWKYKLLLKDIFVLYNNDEIEIPELSNRIAIRIREAAFFSDHEDDLEDIATLFDEADDADSYDYAMADLCDWGDVEISPSERLIHNRQCWVETV